MKKPIKLGPWIDHTDTCGARGEGEHYIAEVLGWLNENDEERWEAYVYKKSDGKTYWEIPMWTMFGEQVAKRMATINLNRLEEEHNEEDTA